MHPQLSRIPEEATETIYKDERIIVNADVQSADSASFDRVKQKRIRRLLPSILRSTILTTSVSDNRWEMLMRSDRTHHWLANRFAMRILITVILTAVTALISGTASADARGRDNTPRQASAPYVRLAVQFWNWALEAPTPVSPFLRPTCDETQKGRTWFLAGSTGDPTPISRTCTVPVGTKLFFPIWNNFYGAFIDDPDRSPKFVLAQPACRTTDLSLVVDNRTVQDRKLQYVSSPQSGLFDIQLPADNIFGLAEPHRTLSPSAQSGYYFLLPPLSRGVHTVHWTASGFCQGSNSGQNVTYTITVAGGHE
jgi:hypothetical protein